MTNQAFIVVETAPGHRCYFVGAFASLESARAWIRAIGGATDEDGHGDVYSVREQALA